MQAVYTHEDKKSISGKTDSMGAVICVGRISRHLEGECIGGFGGRTIRIQDSGGILGKHKKRVWGRR